MVWDNIMDRVVQITTTERINFTLLLIMAGMIQGCFFALQRSFFSVLQVIIIAIFVGNVFAPILEDNTNWSPPTVVGASIIVAFMGKNLLGFLNNITLWLMNNPESLLRIILRKKGE